LELIVIYQILNDVGEVINRIVADEAFVEAAYPGRYRLEGPESLIVDPAIITKIAMITLLERLTLAIPELLTVST